MALMLLPGVRSGAWLDRRMLSGEARWGPVLERGLVLCLFRLIGVFLFFSPCVIDVSSAWHANDPGTGRGKHTRSRSLLGRIWVSLWGR